MSQIRPQLAFHELAADDAEAGLVVLDIGDGDELARLHRDGAVNIRPGGA